MEGIWRTPGKYKERKDNEEKRRECIERRSINKRKYTGLLMGKVDGIVSMGTYFNYKLSFFLLRGHVLTFNSPLTVL